MMPVAGNVSEVLAAPALVLPLDLDIAEMRLALVVNIEIMDAHEFFSRPWFVIGRFQS